MIIRMLLLLVGLGLSWQAAPADTKVGDAWTYEARDGYNKNLKATYRIEVTEVSDTGIATRVTNQVSQKISSERFTRNWNPVVAEWAALRAYEFSPPYPEFPDRIEPGVSWQEQVVSRDPATARQMKMEVLGKVLGHERIHVPAGDFDCLKIGRDTYLDDADVWRGRTRVWEYEWYSPELRRSVKIETRSEYHEISRRNSLRRGDWTIFELTAYKTN